MTSAGQSQVRVNSFENAFVRAHTALSQAGPVFWVAFYGIALILAIALGATLMTSAARDREITRGGKELERADRLLANQLDRHLQSFESVQRSVAAEIVSQVHTAAEFRRLVSTEGFHRFLKNKISDSNDVAGVNVFDSRRTISQLFRKMACSCCKSCRSQVLQNAQGGGFWFAYNY